METLCPKCTILAVKEKSVKSLSLSESEVYIRGLTLKILVYICTTKTHKDSSKLSVFPSQNAIITIENNIMFSSEFQ